MLDYEKASVVTYLFYFINWQSIHKINCMQRIKKILMREVFPAIALKLPSMQRFKRTINTQIRIAVWRAVYYMDIDWRKPAFWVCELQIRRLACVLRSLISTFLIRSDLNLLQTQFQISR